ncbi:MAG TPA: protease modulator HflC [Candidatus Paceibacterota bacterium]|nr:protease modulator HflC [Verrucomicrobiota bacterium]HRY50374.1 protease modulator HflC [Candidatus Paceibacterota bacterium]HSA02329.1 protease modulator HflC [Candidatus Paceibacterota bacterium]
MKRNPITLVTAGILALIFALMLFTFQVRQTEIAVVTTFGKFSRDITAPGFNWRLPWPIQRIYKFDNRIQNFEKKFEQTTTHDAINILITVYAGWRVVNPRLYLESLNGDSVKAEQTLEPLIRNAKNGVISQYRFGELISTNQADLKFDQIETNMLATVRPAASSTYGIEVAFVGIKQVGLPESITTKVFDRMKAERQTRVKQYQTDGEKAARIIRAEADSQANQIMADAKAKVIEITGNAEARASEYYKVLDQNPELANFLFQRNALEQSLKEKATLILDQQTPPFNMMGGQGAGITHSSPLK